VGVTASGDGSIEFFLIGKLSVLVYGAVPAAVLKLAAVLIGICAGSVKLLYIKFILIGLSGYGDHDSGVTFGSNC